MPQTPALFLYSLINPSSSGVLIAVGIGKMLKYVFLAWATAHYPARFIDYR
jgi:membrane protein YqaA with SNARE-associated domain